MNLPGFTAEAAINCLGRDYTKEIVHEFMSSSVVPQAKALEKCNAKVSGRLLRIGRSVFRKQQCGFVFRGCGQSLQPLRRYVRLAVRMNADASRAKWHALKELELSWKAVALLAGGAGTTERK
jgi:predicted transcriptional regulator